MNINKILSWIIAIVSIVSMSVCATAHAFTSQWYYIALGLTFAFAFAISAGYLVKERYPQLKKFAA